MIYPPGSPHLVEIATDEQNHQATPHRLEQEHHMKDLPLMVVKETQMNLPDLEMVGNVQNHGVFEKSNFVFP
jgi:hypothetical protein